MLKAKGIPVGVVNRLLKVGLLIACLNTVKLYAKSGIKGILTKDLHELSQNDINDLNHYIDKINPDEMTQVILEESENQTFKRLLTEKWDQLSDAQKQQILLLSGEISLEAYQAGSHHLTSSLKKKSGVLTAIAEAIWGKWQPIVIPGAFCSDGSPYKIFTMSSKGILNEQAGYRNNLLIYFEPGGACWDYASCSGSTDKWGAANPNGIPDNHMSLFDFLSKKRKGGSVMGIISPLILYNNPSGYYSQTSRWNKVFFPYCTGDVHLGYKKAIYQNPNAQEPPLIFLHYGARNVELSIKYLKEKFGHVEKLMVSGCSAGGTGALGNYHFFRKHLQPKKSYLINDSGPIVPSNSNQGPMHNKIDLAWNIPYITQKLTMDFPNHPSAHDFGSISSLLAEEYPRDKLSISLFKRDGIFSSYSYSEFFHLDPRIPEEKNAILSLWQEDIDTLISQYDQHQNLSYFIPYMRNLNDSHCTTLLTYKGTEINQSNITMSTFINQMLRDEPVQSYEESENQADDKVSDILFWLFNVFST